MSSTSYYKTILSFFHSMDIEKLKLHLKDEYTYQDTTKEIFLTEIENIFNDHKEIGDTLLEIHPGICAATHDVCPNCSNKGYRFIGNNSGNFLDLIFEIDGENIKDIYDCSNFKTIQKIENQNYQDFILINEDDKVTFIKTPDYLNKLNTTIEALNFLTNSLSSPFEYSTIKKWITKYAFVYNSIGGLSYSKPGMKWDVFLSFYNSLNEFLTYIENNADDISKAIKKVNCIKKEEDLIHWLLEYEEKLEIAPLDMLFEYKIVDGLIIFKNKVFLKGVDFENTISFIDVYQEKYYPIFEKYSTYTEEENLVAMNDIECQKYGIDNTSLRFHLEKRKALKEIGISIPFYILKH